MNSLYIVGGGRWSRVVASEAYKLAEKNLDITIISKKNFDGMKKWSLDLFGKNTITILNELPENLKTNSSIYVTNETKLRFETLQTIKHFKVPTLVEKPLMLNSVKAQEIVDSYRNKGIKLSTSQVFRFLDSIGILKHELGETRFESIEFYWFDPFKENRHGEQKKFESDVPIHHDVIPHIHSIMHELFGNIELVLTEIQQDELHETLTLNFKMNSTIEFKTYLSRSASKRLRLLKLSTKSNSINFDFSSEECIQTLTQGLLVKNTNLGYSASLQNMLRAFFESNRFNLVDPRLDANRSLEAIRICEDIDSKLLKSDS